MPYPTPRRNPRGFRATGKKAPHRTVTKEFAVLRHGRWWPTSGGPVVIHRHPPAVRYQSLGLAQTDPPRLQFGLHLLPEVVDVALYAEKGRQQSVGFLSVSLSQRISNRV